MSSFRTKTIETLKWSSLEKIGQAFIQLIISVILARLLDAEIYGIIGIINIFISISSTIADAGFSQGLIRKLKCTFDDYNAVFWCNFFISIILYLILFFLAPYLAVFFDIEQLKILSRVLFLVIPLNAFNIVQVTIINKELNFKAIAKYTLISSSISGILGIGLALSGFGVWALIGQILLNILFQILFFWRRSVWRPQWKFPFEPLKELFPFSFKLFVASFLNSVFNNAYTFLIAKLYTQTQLGFYTQANRFATQPTNLIEGILNRMTYPLLATLQNDIIAYKNAFKRIQISIFAFVMPLMLMLFVCAPEGFPLVLGEKWNSSIPYFQIMCLSGVTLPLHPLCMSTLKVFGMSGVILKLEIVKKILIAGLIFLTYRYGIMGLVWSQFIFFTLALIINMFYSGKTIGYNLFQQFIDLVPYFIFTAVAFVCAWGIGQLLGNLYIILLSKSMIFSGVYMGLILIFKLPEARIIKSGIKKIGVNL